MWNTVLLVYIGICSAVADYASYVEFVNQQAKNETFVRQFEEHLKLFEDRDHGLLRASEIFECKNFSYPTRDTAVSVHQLTPMDIRVVAALGDSITAGTGITAATVLGLLRQDRGKSWSIGGDDSINEEITIPNILKIYNADIQGYSTGWGSWTNEKISRFNLANPGDTSEQIPAQARNLVERMKKDSAVNFNEDWKVITIFVGGNDLCDFCKEKDKYKAENYVARLQDSLDYLHSNVPRAFVNMVDVLDISIVKRLNENFVCDTLHLFLCSCAAFPANSEKEAELQAETKRYRELLSQLINTGRYDTKDDFTVVIQPFFSETVPPMKPDSDDPDLSYFAPDCFHLSLKGHRAAADALWKNMIEPVGKKRTKWTPNEPAECPSVDSPYFYTYKNSVRDSNNLGGAYSGVNAGSDPSTDNKPAKPSPSSSVLTSLATVGGVMVLTGLIIFGVVAARRRLTRREEKEILLTPRNMKYSYVEI